MPGPLRWPLPGFKRGPRSYRPRPVRRTPRGWLFRLEHLPPAAQPVLWFSALIVLGTLLLALPPALRENTTPSEPLTAAFMATSAVCVTGLAVVPVHEHYSAFGQAVLLVLIELGALGLMTFATVGFQLFRRRLSLASQAALDDALFQRGSAADFRKIFASIVRLVLGIQAVGAVWLFAVLLPRHLEDGSGAAAAAWSALFHAVSAFGNAGLSLYPDSLEGFAPHPAALLPFTALILAGSLGHAVLVEGWQRAAVRLRELRHGRFPLPGRVRLAQRRPRSLHARVVLWMTAGLAVIGTAALWITARHGGEAIGLADAAFQAIAARTSGMTSLPVEKLGVAGLVVLCALMFIGGSPGSCAGGIKTTTFAIWMSGLLHGLRARSETTLFGRVIQPELVTKAKLLVGLSCLFNILGVMVLCMTEPNAPAGADRSIHPVAAVDAADRAVDAPPAREAPPAWGLVDLLVEQVSAFATVGLTAGVTPTLSTPGRLWIMLSMFLGRLGPLGMALWIMPAPKGRVRDAHGRVMIG